MASRWVLHSTLQRPNILEGDTKDIKNVNDWDFAISWEGDPKAQNNTPFWGMDTSKVVEVTHGVGVGFVVCMPLICFLRKEEPGMNLA